MPTMLDDESPAHDEKGERRRVHHDADILIVGAGIIGCAAAVAFGQQGRSVVLLERSLKEPDRIVGELLQPGGVRALETLGIRDCLEGIDAVRVEGYEVIYYGEEVRIPYPENADGVEGEKRRPEGRSFHHGRFIQKLRAAAMRTPNVTVVESTVTDTIKNGWTGQILGVECTTKGEKDYVSFDRPSSRYEQPTHGMSCSISVPLPSSVTATPPSSAKSTFHTLPSSAPSSSVLSSSMPIYPCQTMAMSFSGMVHQSCSIKSAPMRHAL